MLFAAGQYALSCSSFAEQYAPRALHVADSQNDGVSRFKLNFFCFPSFRFRGALTHSLRRCRCVGHVAPARLLSLCAMILFVAANTVLSLRVRSTEKQESLALASMARDDPPASSKVSSTPPASSTAAAMRGKVGSEFET